MGKKERIRNLVQYRELSDDDFDKVWEELQERRKEAKENIPDFEEEIQKRLEMFSEDYDLTDMKVNDKMILRALIQSILTLEDYEKRMFSYRMESDGFDKIEYVKKLNDVMTALRKDISSFQNDLNITRKTRKSDKDLSVVAFIDDLKEKAKKTYEAKMKYIYCPKCGMLLGTVWTQYPTGASFKFKCGRGSRGKEDACGNVVEVTIEELEEMGGSNLPERHPDGIK